MAMVSPRLLRGLIAPLSPADWLPCHQQLLTSAEVRFVASASMAPTLRPGDRAVAEKVSYMFRRPSVGDIVFFRVPTALQNCGINKYVVFIKRVIATPGDFIEVRQGQLIVNGVAQNEHYTAPHASYMMEAMVQRYLYAQTSTGHY